jgi:hypothetical protein
MSLNKTTIQKSRACIVADPLACAGRGRVKSQGDGLDTFILTCTCSNHPVARDPTRPSIQDVPLFGVANIGNELPVTNRLLSHGI